MDQFSQLRAPLRLLSALSALGKSPTTLMDGRQQNARVRGRKVNPYPSPTRALFMNSEKPLWPFFPPRVDGRGMFEYQVLVRWLSLLALGSGLGCQERVPKHSSRSPPAPPRREHSLGCARAHPVPSPRALSLSPHQPFHFSSASTGDSVGSHHQAEERKLRWRPFQACKWDPKRPPP